MQFMFNSSRRIAAGIAVSTALLVAAPALATAPQSADQRAFARVAAPALHIDSWFRDSLASVSGAVADDYFRVAPAPQSQPVAVTADDYYRDPAPAVDGGTEF